MSINDDEEALEKDALKAMQFLAEHTPIFNSDVHTGLGWDIKRADRAFQYAANTGAKFYWDTSTFTHEGRRFKLGIKIPDYLEWARKIKQERERVVKYWEGVARRYDAASDRSQSNGKKTL